MRSPCGKNRPMCMEKKNKIWCTDFTYIWLSNGKMRYNYTIIDLYDRCAVAQYVFVSYNHVRPHSYNNWMPHLKHETCSDFFEQSVTKMLDHYNKTHASNQQKPLNYWAFLDRRQTVSIFP